MSDSGNNGKNPWGKPPGGGRDPWGTGGRGAPQGGEGPDLDALFRKFSEQFKGFGGGEGNDGTGKIITLVVLAGVALWLASGFFIVQPGEHAVIQRFGAWNRTKVTEGLGYHFPAPVETATTVNVNEIRRMNIGFFDRSGRGTASAKQDVPEESLMLTSDRNIVDLDLVIQWNIKSAEDFLFKIQDQENTIKKVAESAIREAVGQTQMFPIITTERDAVANKARDIIQRNLDEYHSGVNITQVLIQQAEVHPEVQSAFQDVQSAKQDAEDVQNRARAYREDILPKARGMAIQMVQEAQGYKESAIARSTGDAQRFNDIYKAYLNGEDVTKQRMYIETMEKVLGGAQKIILDDKGGQGVVPYLPLDEIKRPKVQTEK
jgi:membrane protease subunit HflK